MDGLGSGILEWLMANPEDSVRISRRSRLEAIGKNRSIFALTWTRDDLRAHKLFFLEELNAMSPENVLMVLSDMAREAEEGYSKACSSTSFINMISDAEENPR